MSHDFFRPSGARYNDPNGKWRAYFAERDAQTTNEWQSHIDRFGVEKNATFVQQEESARDYLKSLGFDISVDVYLVDDDPDDVVGICEVETTSAIVISEVDGIFIRQSRLCELGMYDNPTTIGRLIVHELAHATQSFDRFNIYVGVPKPGTYKEYYRCGFHVSNGRETQGVFYEEGFADFVASRYQRMLDNDNRAIGIDSTPDLALPYYFQKLDPEKVPGPDGYAMELIAYGLDRKGIMTPDTFVDLLLDTRRPETQLVALRAFARSVEALEPGLYKMLQTMEYGKENWEIACSYVHNLVTKNA
jgi:hypothetical protein